MKQKILAPILFFLFVSASKAQSPSSQKLPESLSNQEVANEVSPSRVARRDGVMTGRVLGENGQPVAGAVISIDNIANSAFPSPNVKSDANGSFKTVGLIPGVYAVEVWAPGYVSDPGTSIHRVGEDVTINMVKGGVITGRVTDANGEPVTGARILTQRVRDTEGRLVNGSVNSASGRILTDDRGIYRLYGLQPGSYTVGANTCSGLYLGGKELGCGVTTYYPSFAREAAVEINVHSGEEISGIDIRHRSERGTSISGTVSMALEKGAASGRASIILINIASDQIVASAPASNTNRFAIYGIPEGEYEIFAVATSEDGDGALSLPRRITVKGADLMGVDLKMFKYGSMTGRVVIERSNRERSPGNCIDQDLFFIEEVMLDIRGDGQDKRSPGRSLALSDQWWNERGRAVNAKGEFRLTHLEAGRYRIRPNLPGEDWYVRSMTQPAIGQAKRSIDVSNSGIAIKWGDKLSGIEVTIAEGAASLRGKVIPAHQTQAEDRTPSTLQARIHLITAEIAAAGDMLRYAEALASKDGSFEFKNLAPGKYWVLARPVRELESTEVQMQPAAWNEIERAQLRREAEDAKQMVELRPCQRMKDYLLRINP